jgi:pSer/pThr/pTyr-binding forkhead associated (FHA) protein
MANPRIQLLPSGPFIEIDGGSLYLGRDCHLAQKIPALTNRVVSNRHCCMKRVKNNDWTIEDLKSTNGTWLNGARLESPAAIHNGDVFSLGRAGPRFGWLLNPTLPPAGAATMLEPEDAESTLLEDADGSDERPFRVGKTPEVTVRHQRTGQEFTAKGYTIVLGRDPDGAQVVIRSDDQRHVSSRHAEIQFRSDRTVVLRDLDSRNGTWLNDRPVKHEAQLKVGDRIVLGASATTLLVSRLDG